MERILAPVPGFRFLRLGESGNTYRFTLDIALGLWYAGPEDTALEIRLCTTQRVKDKLLFTLLKLNHYAVFLVMQSLPGKGKDK